MKTVVCICELNPLHKGHIKMLSEAKSMGFDAVAGIMSGSFVQRGDCALYDKYVRAEAAVRCGFDLILELPFPFSCAPAEKFASGAIELLSKLGFADGLVFGSECGDIEELKKTAELLSSKEYKEKCALYRDDRAYADVPRAKLNGIVFEKEFGSEYPERPNDILGVEYLKALSKEKNCRAIPYTYRRKSGFSASDARKKIGENDYSTVPEAALPLFESAEKHSLKNAERAILYALRAADPKALAGVYETKTDLASRLVNAAKNSATLEEFFEKANSKTYTDARIRRTSVAFLCGANKRLYSIPVSFSKVLAIGKNGKELLKEAKKNGSAELLTKPADIKKLSGESLILAKAGIQADAFYSLTGDKIREDGYLLKKTPYVEK